MARFEGTTKTWDIEFDFGKAVGLKNAGIVNLLSGETEDLLKIQFDMETRGQVYAFICDKQIQDADMTPEDFAAEFGKGKLKVAQELLVKELADFFLEAGQPEIAEFARKLTTEFLEARTALGNKVKGLNIADVIKEKIGNIDLATMVKEQTGSS